MPDKPEGKRTETTVREYDADGDLVKKTTVVTTVAAPKADSQPDLGGYL